MQVNPLLGGAAVFGVIAAAWSKIKEIAYRITSFVIVDAYCNEGMCIAVVIYVRNRMYRSRFGALTFSGVDRYVREKDRRIPVGYESLSVDEPVIFWKGWKPLVITLKGGGNAQSVHMKFVRGTFDLDQLLIDAMTLYGDLQHEDRQSDKQAQKRSFVQRFVGEGRKLMDSSSPLEQAGTKGVTQQYTGHSHTTIFDAQVRYLKWGPKDLIPVATRSKYALDTLAFPVDIHDLIEELKHWKASETWYKERDIMWRRGWLLYGEPGNGKTSLVRALAQDMNMPVFSFDIGSMSNKEFVKYWGMMLSYAPCIALIEDLDAVFHGRENVLGEQGGGLTFDCLLNVVSGIEQNNGVFMVLTTNNPEKLDPAIGVPQGESLSSRPGRIDRAIYLGNPDEECRRRIASRILDQYPQYIEQVVTETEGRSSAQVQERCMEIALENHWHTRRNGHTIPLLLPQPAEESNLLAVVR
jgi:hypothetical protein